MDGSADPRSGQAENRSAAAEQVAMRMTRPQKITVHEMREISIRDRLVCCSDSPAAVPHFTAAIENPMVAVRPRHFGSESARNQGQLTNSLGDVCKRSRWQWFWLW